MKAEIKFVIETHDMDFDFIDSADYKLMAKHVDDKKFKKLDFCVMEVTRLQTIEDDIETVERQVGTDSNEFYTALDNVIAFAKEKNES